MMKAQLHIENWYKKSVQMTSKPAEELKRVMIYHTALLGTITNDAQITC